MQYTTLFIIAAIIVLLWFIWSFAWERSHRNAAPPYTADNTGILKEFLLSEHFAGENLQEVKEVLDLPTREDVMTDEATCRAMIRHYQFIDRNDLAEKYLKILFANFTILASDLTWAASFKIKKSAFSDAIVLLSRALELEPGSAVAYNNRGYARLLTGAYEAAAADLDAALSLDPKFAFAYNNRGYARTMMGNMAGAYDDLILSLQLDDTNGYAYRNLGIWYARQQEWDKARAELEKAAAIDPDIPELAAYTELVRKNG